MSAAASHVAVHWFRKGLRLHDNPALLEAIKDAAALYPIFVLDPHFAHPARVCANRYGFLLESLANLDEGLRKLGSRLFLVQGKPAEVIPHLLATWKVTKLTYEADTEPYAQARDAAVTAAAAAAGVHVRAVHGHTLWEPAAVLAKSSGHMPSAYQSFVKLVSSMPPPPKPFPAPAHLPPPGPLTSLRSATDGSSSSSSSAAAASSSASSSSGSAPQFQYLAAADEFAVPSLSACGYDAATVTTPFRGGETEALARLQRYMARTAWVAAFEKPETSPNTLEPSTTVLSPYMKFGCLGSRQFWWALKAALAAHKGPHSQPPVSLEGQLLWREFFYCNAFATPNFDRMVGNPGCKQIAWGYDPALIAAWEESRTGYPFIDACMAQLRQEGWMHHLARHAVACFLTRGDLYQSWEHGARIFDKYLLDSDWALNNGNWQWLSASAFFYQYFRVYGPVSFGKKTDPTGAYIRKYLPQLSRFPDKFIYEPWKAPLSVQQAAGVIIGRDYPAPIVEHETASKRNIERHAAAYAAGKDGAGAAAAHVSGVPPAALGVGATQVGSDPAAAQAYLLRHGVAFGQLPGGPPAASGTSSRTSAATSSSSSSGGSGTGSGSVSSVASAASAPAQAQDSDDAAFNQDLAGAEPEVEVIAVSRSSTCSSSGGASGSGSGSGSSSSSSAARGGAGEKRKRSGSNDHAAPTSKQQKLIDAFKKAK